MRRLIKTIVVFSVLAALFTTEQASAGFVGLPRALAPVMQRIVFSGPALAPFAHTRFCMQYPADCVAHHTIFRGGPIALTAERREELLQVNARINRSIIPERNTEGLASDKFQQDVMQVFDFEASVEKRDAIGGTSLRMVERQVAALRQILSECL